MYLLLEATRLAHLYSEDLKQKTVGAYQCILTKPEARMVTEDYAGRVSNSVLTST